MTTAHICDECKTVAPLHETTRWWNLEAADSIAGQVLRMGEKPNYEFCSWPCLAAYATRKAGTPA